jgi:hypothetical protein
VGAEKHIFLRADEFPNLLSDSTTVKQIYNLADVKHELKKYKSLDIIRNDVLTHTLSLSLIALSRSLSIYIIN